MVGAIDKKHSFRHIVSLFEFTQKFLRECRCCRRKQPYMRESVRLRINCCHKSVALVTNQKSVISDDCVQTILLLINSDHRLV